MPPDEPSFGPLQLVVVGFETTDAGFVRDCESTEAIDALAERGIVEQALLHGAVAEAEELLEKLDGEPPQPDA